MLVQNIWNWVSWWLHWLDTISHNASWIIPDTYPRTPGPDRWILYTEVRLGASNSSLQQ